MPTTETKIFFTHDKEYLKEIEKQLPENYFEEQYLCIFNDNIEQP